MSDQTSPDMTVRMSGGFRGDAIYARMSPQARQNVANSLHAEAVRARADEEERRARVAAFAEASIRASIVAAAMRGEPVDPREVWQRGGVGRTHREVLIEASDRMDMDDRREAMRRAREGAHVTDADWSTDHSADTTAPDIHSEEAVRQAARKADEIARGRGLQQTRRDTEARIDRALRDLRSMVRYLNGRVLSYDIRADAEGRSF